MSGSRYLISYDISNEFILNKARKLLVSYGFVMLQKSLYISPVGYKLPKSLILGLKSFKKFGEIRVYKLCSKCSNPVYVFGSIKRDKLSEEIIKGKNKDFFYIE